MPIPGHMIYNTCLSFYSTKAVPPAQPRTPTPSVQSYMTKPKIKLVEGFGKGLLADIKGKAPFLKSDITDGFSIKVRTWSQVSMRIHQ